MLFYCKMQSFSQRLLSRDLVVEYALLESALQCFSECWFILYRIVIISMGQNQERQSLVASCYAIVKEVSQNGYWIKRKRTGEELQLRILTFHIEQQMNEYMRLLAKRKKIKNPHILELFQYQRIVEQHMCASTFKIQIITEYPFKSLSEQVKERAACVPARYFSQDQLWSILYSCCNGLYSLYNSRFPHQSLSIEQVLIDRQGIIKICDMVLVEGTKNYLSIMGEHIQEKNLRYISPELINLVDDNNFYHYDKEKSDVFILGMLILQLGNLERVPYFDVNSRKFYFQEKMPALSRFKGRYSIKIWEVVERMLIDDYKIRPKFDQLINNVEEKTVHMPMKNSSRSKMSDSVSESDYLQTFRKGPVSLPNKVNEKANSLIANDAKNSKPIAQQKESSRGLNMTNYEQSSRSSKYPSSTYVPSGQAPLPDYSKINQPYKYQPPPSNSPAKLNHQQSTPILQLQQLQRPQIASSPVRHFDSVLKPTISQKNYTPYHQLLNLSAQNTKQISTVKFTKQQTRQTYHQIQQFQTSNAIKNTAVQSQPTAPTAQTTNKTANVPTFNKYQTGPPVKHSFQPHQNPQQTNMHLFKQNQPSAQQTRTQTSFPTVFMPKNQFTHNTDAGASTQGQRPVSNIAYLAAGSIKVDRTNAIKQELMVRPKSHTSGNINTYAVQTSPPQTKLLDSTFGRININNGNPALLVNQKQSDIINSNQKIVQQSRSLAQQISQFYQVSSIQKEEGQFAIEECERGRYQGFKVKGLRQGVGRMWLTGGGCYEGEWKSGTMNGYGKKYSKNHQIEYEGHWLNDEYHGTGTLHNLNPTLFEQNFNQQDFTQLGSIWTTYQGHFNHGKRNGRGVLVLSNGQKFIGFFSQDAVDGQGVFYGKTFIKQGRWIQNRLVAQ